MITDFNSKLPLSVKRLNNFPKRPDCKLSNRASDLLFFLIEADPNIMSIFQILTKKFQVKFRILALNFVAGFIVLCNWYSLFHSDASVWKRWNLSIIFSSNYNFFFRSKVYFEKLNNMLFIYLFGKSVAGTFV